MTRKTATSNLLTALSGGLALTLCVGFAATACNSVSGADKISLYDTDDDDGAGAGTTNNSGGANAGGNTGSESNGVGGSGGNPDGSGPNATANNSSSTGGPQPCVYPSGPYGVDQGDTVPPSLTWQVFAPGSSSASSLRMEDLHDCDGARNIDVIIIDTSQYG